MRTWQTVKLMYCKYCCNWPCLNCHFFYHLHEISLFDVVELVIVWMICLVISLVHVVFKEHVIWERVAGFNNLFLWMLICFQSHNYVIKWRDTVSLGIWWMYWAVEMSKSKMHTCILAHLYLCGPRRHPWHREPMPPMTPTTLPGGKGWPLPPLGKSLLSLLLFVL